MCGGAGTRLDRGEKPLFEVGGAAMIVRVLNGLDASRVGDILAVTSPETPETTRRLRDRQGVRVFEADGAGYVADLSSALERVDRPVLTVVADLPLLSSDSLNRTIDAHESGAMNVCVPAALKKQLGVSVEATRERDGQSLAPTGVNVVGANGGDTVRVSHDVRLAVNVNRPTDADIAERLLSGTGGDR